MEAIAGSELESNMGLGDFLKGAFEALAVTSAETILIKTWSEIDDPTLLRMKIRDFLREVGSRRVQSLVDSLTSSIRNFQMINEPESRDRLIVVRETLIEEANRMYGSSR
ncbi:MAG: hypothetical protein KDA32_06895 [Phycisphaerales bacterium]|nr:hypothetical protein [Phycisphaerales bacterium]